jgi:hypothetical protein
VSAPRKSRNVWAERSAEMERSIQRDTCGLGHWREPAGWGSEAFSHTVTMVADLMGHVGGWQIYNSGVTVALDVHPIEWPFTRGVPYVWCKAAHDRNGNSGVYPTAPLFGRFLSQTSRGPRVLSGKGKSAVVGADYVYCFRAVGRVGYGDERFTRSEIPVPIPSKAERIDGPAAFDLLQNAAKQLDRLLENMADVADMAGELIEAGEKADAETVHRRRERCEARAYRALQPILNAAIRQSGQVGTELADYLKDSPSLAYWLKRWQADTP